MNQFMIVVQNRLKHNLKKMYLIRKLCNILTSEPAVDQGTGASSRRYQGITLTVDRLNSVQMRRSQEAGGCQTMI